MDPEPPSQPAADSAPTVDTEMIDAPTEEVNKVDNAGLDAGASAVAGDGADTAVTTKAPATNGDVAPEGSEKPDQAAQEAQEPQDEETQNNEAPVAASSQPSSTAAAEGQVANGTPIVNKRASVGGSSKKRASAVPEHKSKKLNRKKSRPLTHLDAKPGEYYFARMKGHPVWPAIIADESMLPATLLSSRPVTAALPDGSFKKDDYADGGKRAYERNFPIMFLATNEFAWLANTELTPLDPNSEEVKHPSEKGKKKDLLAAYAKAAENNDLQSFKDMLKDHEIAVEEDALIKEERAAKKAEKEKRATARKSSEAKIDTEEMEVDDDSGNTKPKSKKRKKASEESDIEEKTPKTATKLRLSTPKQPTESATKKKPQKPKLKTTKSGSDEDAQTPKVEEKPMSPGALREMKEKKVLYFRHKLQRGFLSRDTNPKAEEMEGMSQYLTELETYPDLEGGIIRTTKIHKVLKQMIKLDNIPSEEEIKFKFKDRATKLLAKWNDILASDVPAEEKPEEKTEAKSDSKTEQPKPQPEKSEAPASTQNSKPTINGDAKSADAQPNQKDDVANAATAPKTELPSKPEDKVAGGENGADTAKQGGEGTEEPKKTTEEAKSDAPDVDNGPAGEHKSPPPDAMDTTA